MVSSDELNAAQQQINAARDQTHTNIAAAKSWADLAKASADLSGAGSAVSAAADANRAEIAKDAVFEARDEASGFADSASSEADRAASERGLAEAARDRAEAVPVVQDGLLASIVSDGGSESRAALNATYGTKAEVAAVESAKVSRTARVAHAPALGLYFPEAEGAAGNGTADDLAALTATCALARTAGNGVVHLRHGATYTVTDKVRVEGVTLRGYGATIKAAAGQVAPELLRAQGSIAAIVEGVTLDGNKANNTASSGAHGIYAYNASGWSGVLVVRDVTVKNVHGNGIRAGTSSALTDAANAPASHTVIENVTVTGAGEQGFYLDRLTPVRISGSVAQGCGKDGFWLRMCKDPTFIGCAAHGNTGHGIVTQYALRDRIIGNACTGNSLNGITVGGGDVNWTPSRYPVITGNACTGNSQHGIAVDTTRLGAEGVLVEANGTITGNTCDGSALHGITATCSSHLAVTGNVVRRSGGAGIALATGHCTVAGNTLVDNTQYGVALFQHATGNYGRHRVGVNTVSGATATPYHLASGIVDIKFASLSTSAPTP